MRACLEVCVGSADDARLAVAAGADRIELNRSLHLDGLTPALGALPELIRALPVPVIVMNRPVAGGFAYSREDFAALEAACASIAESGAAGMAFGILDDGGAVDVRRCSAVVDRSRTLGVRELVFHRAFDALADLGAGLEVLIDLGIDRVLTSGGARTAWAGRDALRSLVQRAEGRIEILPGGGVDASCALDLLSATGCDQLHGSFRGAGGVLDGARVREVRSVLDAGNGDEV